MLESEFIKIYKHYIFFFCSGFIEDEWSFKFDVALVTLLTSFDISLPHVNPICLPNDRIIRRLKSVDDSNHIHLHKEELTAIGNQ